MAVGYRMLGGEARGYRDEWVVGVCWSGGERCGARGIMPWMWTVEVGWKGEVGCWGLGQVKEREERRVVGMGSAAVYIVVVMVVVVVWRGGEVGGRSIVCEFVGEDLLRWVWVEMERVSETMPRQR